MSKRRIISALSGLSFVLCLGQYEAAAQSTLMNVPSTDVVAAKKVYVEMDFLTNYAWQRRDSFQNYIPRTVVGLARNVELGANVSFTHVSGRQLPIEAQPNVKWQFYSNEGAGTAAAVGCILYAPISHRAGADTLGQCYLVGSKRISGRLGPRFTGGGFALLPFAQHGPHVEPRSAQPTDQTGGFRLASLAAGTHRFEVATDDGVIQIAPFTVGTAS